MKLPFCLTEKETRNLIETRPGDGFVLSNKRDILDKEKGIKDSGNYYGVMWVKVRVRGFAFTILIRERERRGRRRNGEGREGRG